MKNKLIILSDSMVTDIYINIIALCVERFDIKEIVLFHIFDDKNGYNKENILSSKIIEQLKYIMEGKYNLYDNSTGNYELTDLEGYCDEVSEYYKKLYYILLSHIDEKSIRLNDFYSYLENLKGKSDFIFDVTTLKKDILANLVPAFIENNLGRDIYYFEKTTPLKHNQSDLIHRLQHLEMKYDNLFNDETLGYLIRMKRISKKKIILFSCIFIVLICLSCFISLDLDSDMFNGSGTVITILSFVLYLFDNIGKKRR